MSRNLNLVGYTTDWTFLNQDAVYKNDTTQPSFYMASSFREILCFIPKTYVASMIKRYGRDMNLISNEDVVYLSFS